MSGRPGRSLPPELVTKAQAVLAPLNPEVVERKLLEDLAPELCDIVREVVAEELGKRLIGSDHEAGVTGNE